MPSKKQKGKISADKNLETLNTAVIVAELFSDRFIPISKWIPTCLLPLGNVPLLHLSLNRLLTDGFQKVVIFACSHRNTIERFVEESGYRTRYPFVDIIVFDGYGCKSVGEVMRDIDTNSLLHEVENFVFIPADLLADVSIMEQFSKFAELRKQNPHVALGMVFANRPDFVPQDYEYMQVLSKKDTSVIVDFRRTYKPCKMISCFPSIPLNYRKNIVDTRILLCSKHIPVQFQGNFDFLTIDDLVNEFIVNEEVMSYQIHAQFLGVRSIALSVAPCLKHLMHFNFSTLNVMGSKQLHPPHYFVRESSAKNGVVEYGQPFALSPQCFAYKNCNIHPSVKLVGHVFIGRNVTIRPGCVLVDVVIGDACTVDKNTLIESSVLMGGVHIGSNVKLSSCFLFTGACIHKEVKLGPDCFVGPPLKSGVASKCPHPNRFCIEHIEGESFPGGSVIIQSVEEDSELPWVVCQPQDSFGGVSVRSFDSSDEDGSESSEKMNSLLQKSGSLWLTTWVRRQMRVRSSSSIVLLSNSAAGESPSQTSSLKVEKVAAPEEDEDEGLIQEIAMMLRNGVRGRNSVAHICSEITCLKFATVLDMDDLIMLLTKAVLYLTPGEAKLTTAQAWQKIEQNVKNFAEVMQHFMRSVSNGGTLCLQATEENCCMDKRFMEMSPRLFHLLYNEDLVSEEEIYDWVKNSKMLEDPESVNDAERLRERLAVFLEWLKTAESESDEEDDDDNE